MAKSKEEKKDEWMNKSTMAKSLGISVQAFDKWDVSPVARIGREAFFIVSDVVKNRLDNFEKQQPGAGIYDIRDQEAQELRLTTAKAENMEIKNEVARAKLVPLEVLVFAVSKFCSECAGVLDSLPITIKRKHPELSVQAIESLKRESVRALNAMASGPDVLEGCIEEYVNTLE